jgi:hypothetical protein
MSAESTGLYYEDFDRKKVAWARRKKCLNVGAQRQVCRSKTPKLKTHIRRKLGGSQIIPVKDSRQGSNHTRIWDVPSP